MNFEQELLRIAGRKKIGLIKIAEEIGVNRITLQRVMRGEVEPSFETKARIVYYIESELKTQDK